VGDLVKKNHYHTLGVEPGASSAEIQKAYTDLAKFAHPDLGGNYDAMVALNEAYNTLKDSSKRFWYDREMGFSRVSESEVRKRSGERAKSGRKVGPSKRHKRIHEAVNLAVKVAILVNLIILMTLLFAFLFNTYLR